MKCEELASFAAACLWFVLRTAAFSMDLSRAGEVVVSMISVLLSSKNWKGEDQVHFILSRLRNVAPQPIWSLRSAPLPDSSQGRKVEDFQKLAVLSSTRLAVSHTSLLHLKMGATMTEDVVGSSYFCHSAERDLPAVNEAKRCMDLHTTSEMPETSSPYMAAGCRPH